MNSGEKDARPSATVVPFSRPDPAVPEASLLGLKQVMTFEPSQFWAILDMLPIAVLVGRGRDCAEIDGNTAARMLLQAPPGQNLSRSAPEDEKPPFEIFSDGRLVAPGDLPMQRAARTGKPVHRSECELRFANGGTVFLAGHSVPLVDHDGTVCGSIGTFVDITDVKQLEQQNDRLTRETQRLNAELRQRVRDEVAERETMQERLGHMQRMGALGQLAGGIAHDINNVLHAAQGAAELILRNPENAGRVRHFADIITASVDQGTAVTRRVLDFARAEASSLQQVDLVALLVGLQTILGHTLGAGISLRVQSEAGLPAVTVDPRQLETVLINLAINARDSMDGRGPLTLAAGLTRIAPGTESGLPVALEPGRYVRLAVSDAGCGMTPEVLAKVTEPFFTTKPHGTGLGLAMAHDAARKWGGALHIDSAHGLGTTVRLWLPVID